MTAGALVRHRPCIVPLWSVSCYWCSVIQVSGIRCQVPGARCQVSGVRCQVLGVECEVPGVKCQVPGARCQVSGARCHVSDTREGCFMSMSLHFELLVLTSSGMPLLMQIQLLITCDKTATTKEQCRHGGGPTRQRASGHGYIRRPVAEGV